MDFEWPWPTAPTSPSSASTRRRNRGTPTSNRPTYTLLPHPRLLVVSDGGHTTTAFSDEGTWTVPALGTDVVESVGAGDAFVAGFLIGLLRGGDAARAGTQTWSGLVGRRIRVRGGRYGAARTRSGHLGDGPRVA